MRSASLVLTAFLFGLGALLSQPNSRVEVVLDTQGVLLDTIRAKHLYGIGRPTDHMGEIFIWDNAVFVAAITPDTKEPYVRRFVKGLEASFLWYADVPEWDTFFIDRPVHSLLDLAKAIDSMAVLNNLDTSQPYPFLMIAKMNSGKGEILFRDFSQDQKPYIFGIEQKRAQMIGFRHGSLPLSMDEDSNGIQIHFRLQNKYHAGVLTEAVFDDKEPIKLFLPRQTVKQVNPAIKVNDTDFSKGRLGNIQEIDLNDLAKFHGHLCDGLAEGFLALQYGLYQLFPDSIIDRTNVRIVSKPSPCLTDVAIYLTGARYQFNTFYVSKNVDGLFVVQRIDNGKSLVIRRNPGVKPAEIDQLGDLAIAGKLPSCDLDKLKKLEEDYMAFLLKTPVSTNFQCVEIPDFKWNPDLKNDFIKTDVLNKAKPGCN